MVVQPVECYPLEGVEGVGAGHGRGRGKVAQVVCTVHMEPAEVWEVMQNILLRVKRQDRVACELLKLRRQVLGLAIAEVNCAVDHDQVREVRKGKDSSCELSGERKVLQHQLRYVRGLEGDIAHAERERPFECTHVLWKIP